MKNPNSKLKTSQTSAFELLEIDTSVPHYFVVNRGPDWQRHCGTIRDVECVLSIYPDATVTQRFPPIPQTVDVPHIRVNEQELPMQQSLPESQSIKLEL
jgi:hypothetical protein